jgi:hypothetical protein
MTMDEQARHAAFMSALVTEHFVLQSAASTTVSEAGSRASLYVFSLSSSLIAMGFTAETDAFATFVAALLPALFVLGCSPSCGWSTHPSRATESRRRWATSGASTAS